MTKQTTRNLFSLALGGTLAACSAAPPEDQQVSPTQRDARTPQTFDEELPPPGYGTLRQDDFTIAFTADRVQVKVTPLHEGVIRLAAPDTYRRLHGLVESRSDWIQQRAQLEGMRGQPRVFLVSFFTYDLQMAFDPTDLQVLNQGILYFPRGILPLTPEWGREQLKQQEIQQALYLFDPAIDLSVLVEVGYRGTRSAAWAGIIRTLQTERARVVSRVEG